MRPLNIATFIKVAFKVAPRINAALKNKQLTFGEAISLAANVAETTVDTLGLRDATVAVVLEEPQAALPLPVQPAVDCKLAETVADTETLVTLDDIMEVWKQSPIAMLPLMATDTRYWALPEEVWKDVLDSTEIPISGTPERFSHNSFARGFSYETIRRFGVNGAGVLINMQDHHAYCVLLTSSADPDKPPLRFSYWKAEGSELVESDGIHFGMGGWVAIL